MAPQVRLVQRGPNAIPLPYTASPLKLLRSDIRLALGYAWALPLAFLPLRLGNTQPMDELYPSFQSIKSVLVQLFLTVSQTLFLLSIPFAVMLMIPALWIIAYIAAVLLLNHVICMLYLNGFQRILVSQVQVPEQPSHAHEHWFFMNGIAGG